MSRMLKYLKVVYVGTNYLRYYSGIFSKRKLIQTGR